MLGDLYGGTHSSGSFLCRIPPELSSWQNHLQEGELVWGLFLPCSVVPPIGHKAFMPPANTMSSIVVFPHVCKKSALSLSLLSFLSFSLHHHHLSPLFFFFTLLHFYRDIPKINKHLWFLIRKRIGSSV